MKLKFSIERNNIRATNKSLKRIRFKDIDTLKLRCDVKQQYNLLSIIDLSACEMVRILDSFTGCV